VNAELRAKKEQVLVLLEQGLSDVEIADRVGINHLTVAVWRRQWQRQRKVEAEVRKLKESGRLEVGPLPEQPEERNRPEQQSADDQPAPEPSEGRTKVWFEPGQVWEATVVEVRSYGAIAEIRDQTGRAVGRGLIHRTQFWPEGEEPAEPWYPDQYLQPGDLVRVAIEEVKGPRRLSLSLAAAGHRLPQRPVRPSQFAKSKPRGRDVLRLQGEHSPRAAIAALQAAIAALEEADPAERLTVSIEVRRTGRPASGGEAAD